MDIASLRKDRKLTQAQFAEVLGVSVGYIGHIEQGVRRPSLKLASKIEAALGADGLVAEVVAEKTGMAA